MWMKEPFLNGSVLEPFIVMRMQEGAEGESTAISWTPKWGEDKKLDKLDMVNSEARRRPKYPREQAARNM